MSMHMLNKFVSIHSNYLKKFAFKVTANHRESSRCHIQFTGGVLGTCEKWSPSFNVLEYHIDSHLRLIEKLISNIEVSKGYVSQIELSKKTKLLAGEY